MCYTTTKGVEISKEVADELQSASQRVRSGHCADRLWTRHLSESDREQLGGDLEEAYKDTGTVRMWAKLRKTSLERATIEVANLLGFLTDSDSRWLLREIGEPADAEEKMALAVNSGDLVIVERMREVYWRGEQIDVDWYRHNVLWEFFWALAENAKVSHGVDNDTFGAFRISDEDTEIGKPKPPATVTKRKNRLKNLAGFPLELWKRIKPCGRGTQRLILSPAEIYLFSEDVAGQLKEVMR